MNWWKTNYVWGLFFSKLNCRCLYKINQSESNIRVLMKSRFILLIFELFLLFRICNPSSIRSWVSFRIRLFMIVHIYMYEIKWYKVIFSYNHLFSFYIFLSLLCVINRSCARSFFFLLIIYSDLINMNFQVRTLCVNVNIKWRFALAFGELDSFVFRNVL